MLRLRLALNLQIARQLRAGEITAGQARVLRRAIHSDEILLDVGAAMLAEANVVGVVAESALENVAAFDWAALFEFLWEHREEIIRIIMLLFGL